MAFDLQYIWSPFQIQFRICFVNEYSISKELQLKSLFSICKRQEHEVLSNDIVFIFRRENSRKAQSKTKNIEKLTFQLAEFRNGKSRNRNFGSNTFNSKLSA